MERTEGLGVRRRFWCAWSGRDVEVEFLTRGLPGFRSALAVRRCTAFEPPDTIECSRHCLDPGFRRLWPLTMPTATEEARQ